MERVAFLIESTGERLRCLLNPESVLLRRLSGVAPKRAAGGLTTGSNLADDPLFFTGGGLTELTLDLLFDVNVSGSSIESEDVRRLTGPLWQLSENASGIEGRNRPPIARFVWGKAWNVPGVISAVSERLEYFDSGGTPQRSWLRLRMLRVAEDADDLVGGAIAPPPLPETGAETPPDVVGDEGAVHEIIGAGSGDDLETERLDQLAFRFYGGAEDWRVLAWLNDIDDPLRLTVGTVLRIASQDDLDAGSEASP